MPGDDIARLYDFTAGTTIQSSQVDGEFNQLVSTMNTKFGRGIANTITGNNIFSGDNTFSGTNTFSHATSPIKSDFILEYTGAAGVTIDSVRLKDGMVKVAGTAASNGEIGYASNQFQGYRNGSLKNFLLDGDHSYKWVLARSSNTMWDGSVLGAVFICTSTFTQTIDAAATLGSGWFCFFRNDGTGVITIDPNGSETIDGRTTITAYQGESFMIVCDGSNFKTIGRRKRFISAGQTITSAGTLTIAHGESTDPRKAYIQLVCLSAELGYAVGDVVTPIPPQDGGGSTGIGCDVFWDGTGNIKVQYGSDAKPFCVRKRSATVGTQVFLTNASWEMRVVAEW